MIDIKYSLANGAQILIIPAKFVFELSKHRQLKNKDRETGGLIFATISKNIITVTHITKPSHLSIRSRFSITMNQCTSRSTIRKFFKKNWHYIGEWHTHPEPIPTPSPQDLKTIGSRYKKSRHDLAGLLMLIVGTEAIYAAIQDENGLHQLQTSNLTDQTTYFFSC